MVVVSIIVIEELSAGNSKKLLPIHPFSSSPCVTSTLFFDDIISIYTFFAINISPILHHTDISQNNEMLRHIVNVERLTDVPHEKSTYALLTIKSLHTIVDPVILMQV